MPPIGTIASSTRLPASTPESQHPSPMPKPNMAIRKATLNSARCAFEAPGAASSTARSSSVASKSRSLWAMATVDSLCDSPSKKSVCRRKSVVQIKNAIPVVASSSVLEPRISLILFRSGTNELQRDEDSALAAGTRSIIHAAANPAIEITSSTIAMSHSRPGKNSPPSPSVPFK